MRVRRLIYVVTVFVLISVFLYFMILPASKMKLETSAIPEKRAVHLIIDAGHGGEDGGAVSADGTLEKGINLSISNDLFDLLTILGFNAEKTRVNDNALSDEGESVKERKYNDMMLRLEKFNSSDDNVIISVHQNKFSNTSSKGTQVFYSPNNENSLKLADSIKFSVKSLLQPDNERLSKPADGNIFLLKNTALPAVIVECGFLSNVEECQKLTDEDYQRDMAFGIAAGFLDFYNTNY